MKTSIIFLIMLLSSLAHGQDQKKLLLFEPLDKNFSDSVLEEHIKKTAILYLTKQNDFHFTIGSDEVNTSGTVNVYAVKFTVTRDTNDRYILSLGLRNIKQQQALKKISREDIPRSELIRSIEIGLSVLFEKVKIELENEEEKRQREQNLRERKKARAGRRYPRPKSKHTLEEETALLDFKKRIRGLEFDIELKFKEIDDKNDSRNLASNISNDPRTNAPRKESDLTLDALVTQGDLKNNNEDKNLAGRLDIYAGYQNLSNTSHGLIETQNNIKYIMARANYEKRGYGGTLAIGKSLEKEEYDLPIYKEALLFRRYALKRIDFITGIQYQSLPFINIAKLTDGFQAFNANITSFYAEFLIPWVSFKRNFYVSAFLHRSITGTSDYPEGTNIVGSGMGAKGYLEKLIWNFDLNLHYSQSDYKGSLEVANRILETSLSYRF